MKPPPAASAALGSAVHAELEKYLKTGEMPDFVKDANVGNIAASGLHHLPKPKTPGMEVERYFKFQSPETGIWYRGFKDLSLAPDADGVPTVLDHKTTSDLKWAKTPTDLLTDTQAIIYAKDELLRWPSAPAVRLQWTYFQTRGTRKSLPVLQTVTRDHVDHTFPQIELGASSIVSTLQSKTQPLDLPPNPRACDQYGGCPFRAQCNLGPREALRAMANADQTNELLTRLGADSQPGGLLAGLLGKKPVAEKPVLADTEVPAPTEIPAAFTGPKTDQPINPPEFQPPPSQAVAPQPEAAEPEASAPTPASDSGNSSDKPKRGRPKGSKNKSTSGDVPQESASVNNHVTIFYDAAQTGRTDSSTPNQANAPRAEGFTLYVDCFPQGRPATVASKIISRAHDEIRSAKGVYDYRSVQYGEGAGMLSTRVAELAASGEYGDVVLDSRTPEGNVCLEALKAKASFVVQGIPR